MKNSQKGSGLIIVIILVVILIAGGYYFFIMSPNKSIDKSGDTSKIQTTPTDNKVVSEWKTFENKEESFSYKYPDSWQPADGGEGFKNIITEIPGVVEEFHVVVMGSNVAFATSKEFESKQVTIDGKSATQYSVIFPGKDNQGPNAGIDIKLLQYKIDYNNKQILISYLVNNDYFTKHQDTIENIIKSFSFGK